MKDCLQLVVSSCQVYTSVKILIQLKTNKYITSTVVASWCSIHHAHSSQVWEDHCA